MDKVSGHRTGCRPAKDKGEGLRRQIPVHSSIVTPDCMAEQLGTKDRNDQESLTESESEELRRAIEFEEKFVDFVMTLPAMSPENVESCKRKQLMRSTSELAVSSSPESGMEHLDNLYKLMEHLERLKRQNIKLQQRVQYLENVSGEQEGTVHDSCDGSGQSTRRQSRNKRSAKCKSSHYGLRQTVVRSTRARSRSVGVEDMMKDVSGPLMGAKSKVSKWTKVKEAFKWEKASSGVLPEAKSQDSGLGVGEDRYLRVPHSASDPPSSSFSVSPADSVLSGQSRSRRSIQYESGTHISSTSSSEDELELESNEDKAQGVIWSAEEATRRSKSLDGDTTIAPGSIFEFQLTSKSGHQLQKTHRTAWSKMKDIIQTRTGSIKRRKAGESVSDVEEEKTTLEHSATSIIGEESCPVIACEIVGTADAAPERPTEGVNRRRLAPVLTITLPSTEELRTAVEASRVLPQPHQKIVESTAMSSKPPPSPQAEVKTTGAGHHYEETYKCQVGFNSAGASPPSTRRASNWCKVKSAFLNSSADHNKELLGKISSSVPSSPDKAVNFLYDMELDDLSSGEFVEVLHDDVFRAEEGGTTQTEIQRNFEELQLNLSHEFHKKLTEWEKIKCGGSNAGTPTICKVSSSGVSSGTSSVGDDLPHDKEFKRKMDEWEKMKLQPGKQRELAALQQLGEETLSPDFKKKLEEWQKIKSVPFSPTPESICIGQPQFKRKITEWQRWRPGSGSHITSEQELHQKVQDWARLKASDSPDSAKIPSPKFYHCGDHSGEQKVVKKGHLVGETNKWSEYSLAHGRILHKGKTHEVKELAWLEKELHKIEREKIRLEREREKYLEREARLEKMRRAIGSGATKQEVLIPTSTGLFRFQGISQKFTRKLYEWEKAKGIGPEASTFALLDPGYQPPQRLLHIGNNDTGNGKVLTRSKSVGSVVDMTVSCQAGITHQPSSLSLNDMESLEETHLAVASDPQGSTEGELGGQLLLEYDDEPEAMIVDVEDVIEETASLLVEEPAPSEIPVYCYAPAEVTRLIDSSGSDNSEQMNLEGREAVQSSYNLLQENMSLLNKLKMKETICRNLENEMENLESKIHDLAESHKEQLGQLELPADDERKKGGAGETERLVTVRARISELEKHKDHLRQEGETLQHYFVEQSEQQAALAQNLVGKLKQLQEVQMSISEQPVAIDPTDRGLNTQQDEAMAMVQDLTMQLFNMAEKLESAVRERNSEICSLRAALREKKTARKFRSGQLWLSTDSMPSLYNPDAETKFECVFQRRSSDELSQLPSLLTNKILQLKRGLSYLCAASDVPRDPVSGLQDMPSELSSESSVSDASEAKEEIAPSIVLKIGNSTARPSVAAFAPLKDSQVKHHECYTGSEQEDGNTTPVTSFTFTPAFLRKRNPDLSVRDNEVEKNLNTAGDLVKNGNAYSKQELIRQSVECDNAGMVDSERTVTIRLVDKKDSERLRFEEDSEEVHMTEEDNFRSFNITERVITEPRAFVEDNNSVVVQKCKNENRKLVNLLKTRRVTDTHVDYDHSGDDEEVVEVRSRPFSITQARISQCNPNTVKLDDISSVKEPARKLPLQHETECITQVASVDNADCVNEDSGNRSNAPINVFVPTTRTIFSPAQRDGKGKTRSVVSYVIDENKNIEDSQNKLGVEILKEEEVNVCGTIEDSRTEANTSEPSIEKEKEDRPTSFIFPPFWILQETRAQSASPALQRRYMRHTKTKEIMATERIPKPNNSEPFNSMISNDCCADPNKFKEPGLKHDFLPKSVINCMSRGSKKLHSSTDNYDIKSMTYTASPPANTTSSDREATCFRNNSENKLRESDTSKKDSSSSESSIDHYRCDKKDILPFRRTETGFPPISPLTRRRDFSSSPKEAAPSIRMMIARYNQKVTEQDRSGTKSPESGSGSPVAWRSPIAERRVRAQMERYQEEVRRVLENSSSREVQKSASAGFIRPSAVGRESQTCSCKVDVQVPSRGILKSSSAGTIKPMSPLVSRSEKITAIKIDECANKISILPPLLEPFSPDERTSKDMKVMDQMQKSDLVLPENSEKTRAMKLQLAKEEFFSRDLRRESLTTDSCNGEKMRSDVRLNRLSQISCESESSYDGSSILVSGQEQYRDCDGILLVKSASAGMINMDASIADDSIPHSPSNSSVPSTSSSVTPKTSRFGLSNLASRFRKVRMRRNKGRNENSTSAKMDTVSTLCRQSLVVDIDRPGDRDGDPITSKSCPSSPVLSRQKRDTSCWIRNPAKKIFKPK